MRAKQVAFLAGTALALGVAASSSAQDIYKMAEPDGHVVITDHPNPESRVLAHYAGGSGTASVTVAAAARAPVEEVPLEGTTPAQPGTVNAPYPMQSALPSGAGVTPFDEVTQALETMTRMSSPRVARIDAAEAARANRSAALPPANPLHFFNVTFQPAAMAKYQDAPRKGGRILRLPGLNWAAAGEMTLLLVVLAAAVGVLLVPAWRARLFDLFGAAHAGGGMLPGSAR